METRILSNLVVDGGVALIKDFSEFPSDPRIGTLVVKDQCLYCYIKIGGMETWYPFATKTNSYIHVQGLPSSTWTVNHQLGSTDVWVQVKNSNGNVIYAQTTPIDVNTVRVDLSYAESGTVVVVAPDSIDVPQIKASVLTVANGAVQIDASGVAVNGEYIGSSSSELLLWQGI